VGNLVQGGRRRLPLLHRVLGLGRLLCCMEIRRMATARAEVLYRGRTQWRLLSPRPAHVGLFPPRLFLGQGRSQRDTGRSRGRIQVKTTKVRSRRRLRLVLGRDGADDRDPQPDLPVDIGRRTDAPRRMDLPSNRWLKVGASRPRASPAGQGLCGISGRLHAAVQAQRPRSIAPPTKSIRYR
jgi:hypothetical protein